MLPKLVGILFQFINLYYFVNCYICDSPEDSVILDEFQQQSANLTYIQHLPNSSSEEAESDTAFYHIRFGDKWPSGIVKYKLHQSLTQDDIAIVRKAFEEYHTKTCIRFMPRNATDKDFVSIELDNRVCGLSRVCKIGGYQFVRFGSHCQCADVIIHELGHTLCLQHENQRADRDNYIQFPNCDRNTVRKKKSKVTNSAKGIYDYASQMHYECGSCPLGGWPKMENVNECGHHLTPGLSLFDADNINSLYNCQGCNRHRWISGAFLSHQDKINMESFDTKETMGDESHLFPCRASFRGEVIPGKYEDSKRTCYVAYKNKVHGATRDFEVLTFPKGLRNKCSIYKLTKASQVSLDTAMSAGTSFRRFNVRTYLAYGTITLSNGLRKKAIGFVEDYEDADGEKILGNNATLIIDTRVFDTSNFKVLTCSLDKDCMIHEWYSRF